MIQEVLKLDSGNKGAKSMILYGVHGNEISGISAVQKIIKNLKIQSGLVYFVMGNPRAVAQNVRFTEANLNRMFEDKNILIQKYSEKVLNTYEFQRAKFLKTLFKEVDILLDIHDSSITESQPFIICEKNGFEIAKYLPVNKIVSGFDSIEPGGTDYFMNKIGKTGICLECGYFGNPNSQKIAEQGILNFLQYRQHLNPNNLNQLTIQNTQKRYQLSLKYYTKTNNFKLIKSFKDFEKLKKNQLIGLDGKDQVMAPDDCFILFAHNRKQAGSEAFLLGKSE